MRRAVASQICKGIIYTPAEFAPLEERTLHTYVTSHIPPLEMKIIVN